MEQIVKHILNQAITKDIAKNHFDRQSICARLALT